MDRSEKIKQIVEHYGEDAQILQAVEELTELTLALLHYAKRPDNALSVLEELADAQIMIDQLRIIFGKINPSLYWSFEDIKLDRQMSRIAKEAV